MTLKFPGQSWMPLTNGLGNQTINLTYNKTSHLITSANPSADFGIINTGDPGSQMYWHAGSDVPWLDASTFVMATHTEPYEKFYPVDNPNYANNFQIDTYAGSYGGGSGNYIYAYDTGNCNINFNTGQPWPLPDGAPDCAAWIGYPNELYKPLGGIKVPAEDFFGDGSIEIKPAAAAANGLSGTPIDVVFNTPLDAWQQDVRTITSSSTWDSLAPNLYSGHLSFNADNVVGFPSISQTSPQTITVNLNVVTASPPDNFTLHPLGGGSTTSCSGTNSQINLKWDTSVGATSYNVYRDNNTTTPIATGLPSSATTFTDTVANSSTHSYFVRAINSNGFTNSNSISITSANCSGPPDPFNLDDVGAGTTLSCSGPNSQVNLKWTASTGATTYEVFRDGISIQAGLPNTVTTFTDTVANSSLHSYKIVAHNSSGDTSSNTIILTSADCTTPPGNPTLDPLGGGSDTSCSGINSQIKLKWSAPSGATSYEVYRDSDPAIPLGNVTTYTDSAVTAGTTYSYHIRALNSAGHSPDSNTVSITATYCSGNITVKATLDGSAWTGSLSYSLFGPSNLSHASVPFTHSNQQGGIWNLLLTSGGPAAATLNSITVSNPQTLASNVSSAPAITFTFNFVTSTTAPAPPTDPTIDNFATSGGTVACGQVKLTWVDASTNEDGFKVYKSPNANPADTNFANAVQTGINIISTTIAGTGSIYTYQYSPPATGITYNYWIVAYNSGGVSAPTNPISLADTSCTAVLTTSDKDIVAINNSNIGSGVGNQCSGPDPLPANTNLKLNDKLKFSINLCNTGTNPATAITLTDTMLNLKQPGTGWNAYYDNGSGPPGGVPIASAGISLTTSGNTLTFSGIPNIPASTSPPTPNIRRITFEAQLNVAPGFTGSIAHFRNCFNVHYKNNGFNFTDWSDCTSLLPFLIGKAPPTINEVP